MKNDSSPTLTLRQEIECDLNNLQNIIDKKMCDCKKTISHNPEKNDAFEDIFILGKWSSILTQLKTEMLASDIFRQSDTRNNSEGYSKDEEDSQVICDTTELNRHSDITNNCKDAETDSDGFFSSGNEQWSELSDDFSYTKLSAFLFGGKKYAVKDMLSLLVKVCVMLYNMDKNKFLLMLNEPFIHGKKSRYIALEHNIRKDNNEGNYYKEINNSNIFILTNTPNNLKAALILNMLRFYELPSDYIKISIRQDYYTEKKEVQSRIVNEEYGKSYEWEDNITDNQEYVHAKSHIAMQNPIQKEMHRLDKAEKNLQGDFEEEKKKSGETDADKVEFQDKYKSFKVFCEEMILYYPYNMSIIFFLEEMKDIFSDNENDAYYKFQKPERLSNGLWIETSNITENIVNIVKTFCE